MAVDSEDADFLYRMKGGFLKVWMISFTLKKTGHHLLKWQKNCKLQDKVWPTLHWLPTWMKRRQIWSFLVLDLPGSDSHYLMGILLVEKKKKVSNRYFSRNPLLPPETDSTFHFAEMPREMKPFGPLPSTNQHPIPIHWLHSVRTSILTATDFTFLCPPPLLFLQCSNVDRRTDGQPVRRELIILAWLCWNALQSHLVSREPGTVGQTWLE